MCCDSGEPLWHLPTSSEKEKIAGGEKAKLAILFVNSQKRYIREMGNPQ
jgi:hypothetical protein